MKGLKDILANDAKIMRHLAEARQQDNGLEIQAMTSLPFGFSDGEDVQIERFCRMISLGISTPFPRSQQQLAYAVIGIKKALKTISLVELLYRKPEVVQLAAEDIRSDVKPIQELGELLQQPLFQQSLPNLSQAVRFMHEKDQQDILKILRLKLMKL